MAGMSMGKFDGGIVALVGHIIGRLRSQGDAVMESRRARRRSSGGANACLHRLDLGTPLSHLRDFYDKHTKRLAWI